MRRRILVSALVLAAAGPAAAQPGLPADLVSLDGPWRMARGSDPRWSATDFDDITWSTVEVPLAMPAPRPGRRDQGDVWLRRRLRLALRSESEPFGVLVPPPPLGHYRVFVNGQEVGRYVRSQLGLATPPPRVFTLPVGALGGDGIVQLALRFVPAEGVALRMIHQAGAIGEGLAIGRLDRLRAHAELARLRALRGAAGSLLLTCIFAGFGLYHLQLFGRRRRLHTYLWFGLLSGLVAVLSFITSPWVFELSQRLDALQRLLIVVGHLTHAAALQFLWSFLGQPVHPLLRRYQQSHLALAVLVAVLPQGLLVAIHLPHLLWHLPGLAAITLLLAREVWRGNPEARTVGFGALFGVATGLAETLRLAWFGETTAPLVYWAFLVFALSLSLSLSNRYSRVHGELDRLRLDLERMVADRTEELTNANRKLQSEIAERRLAEGAMRKLERAVEQSRDGIAITDPEGNTQFINESWARLHGYEVMSVLGQHLSVFFTQEQLHEHLMPFMRQVEERGALEGEVDHRHQDGSTIPTWMSVTLLRDPDGQPAGFVAFARDISRRRAAASERMQLETKVQKAARLESLASLAGGIAHDYNNLLTAVLSNASLALRELPAGLAVRDKIQQIEAAAERARDLTGQLLAYAGEDVAVRPAQLNDVVRGMEEALRSLIGERAALDLQLKDDLPKVEMDPEQIRQLILNLGHNALESLGTEPGFITVRSSLLELDREYLEGSVVEGEHRAGAWVILEVSDSGMGMDDETKARMFEPLFTTKSSGSGMGLAAVLGIVRAHHGTIKVFSEAGRGTTVQVLLPPAAAEHERPAPAPAAAGDLDAWRGGGTVLVVDDEDIVREVARAILEDTGFEVLVAGDGPSGIDLYRQRRDEVRVVLLDWTMPDMNGEQVFREIRQQAPRARVILMSGYREHMVMHDLGSLGLAGFLQKPFKPDELIAKVREALA